jgi:MYXO-CTERM domain-containing protein
VVVSEHDPPEAAHGCGVGYSGGAPTLALLSVIGLVLVLRRRRGA